MKNDIHAIYFLVDEFCKIYLQWQKHRLVGEVGKIRLRDNLMSLSEMLTVMIIFHTSPCREFKFFYLHCLAVRHQDKFPKILSYNRFVELMPRLLIPMVCLLHCLSGKKEGVYFIDSTKMQICHNKRTNSNRVFKGLAKIGKSSYGFDDLFRRGLKIITGIKTNMKNYLFLLHEKILLRKRSLIESVFNIMKNHMNLEHTRHRSPVNFLVNAISCLVAYQFKTNKPKIKNTFDCDNKTSSFFTEKLLGFGV
jgi:hypothetical protein